MRRGKRQFPGSGSTERAEFPGRFHVDQLDVVRNILDVGQPAAAQVGVLFYVIKVLGQGQTNALGDPAVKIYLYQEIRTVI